MTVKAPEAGEEEKKDPPVDEEDVGKGKAGEEGEEKENGENNGKGKKDDAENEPPQNHPRWKEVYHKLKEAQAVAEDQGKDLDALRNHARNLEQRLLEVSEKKADKGSEPRPDPAIDPEAYAKWVDLQYKLKEEKAEKDRAIQRLEDKRDMAEAMWDDYPDVVRLAERDMERDPELKKKIWSQPNPFIAAYKYGDQKRKKMTDDDKEKARTQKENKDKGRVEGGGTPEGEEDEAPELTDQEQRVIRNLFPDLKADDAKKKYLASRKKMYGR